MNRRFDDVETPLAGKVILFLAGFVMTAMVLIMVIV